MNILDRIQQEAIDNFFSRLCSKVNKTDTCWLWEGSLNRDGYGLFHVLGTMRSAHRVMYELFNGVIPPELEIDHLCRVRNCVNPEHLEAVTKEENLLRAVSRRTHCVNGHDYEANSFINSKGNRECRICNRVNTLAWQRRNRDLGIGLRKDWTHCKNGHELKGSNLIRNKNGSRRCRQCKNEWQRKARASV